MGLREQPGGGTVIGDSRNLKALAAVVDRPEALNLLEHGANLADAALATEHTGEQFTRALSLSASDLMLLKGCSAAYPSQQMLTEIFSLK